jgi:hypothetical protein
LGVPKHHALASIIGIVISGLAITPVGVLPVLWVGAVLSEIVMVIFSPEVLQAGRAHSSVETEKNTSEDIA